MVAKPITTKDSLKSDLNTVLVTVEGKIDPASAQRIKQAMDKLLEHDNKFNREVLVSAVDELLIVGDSKELNTQEIKKILTFLKSLKNFIAVGLKNLYEYDAVLYNALLEEQQKVRKRIENIQETERVRFRR
jgi:hypothetical protein